MTSRSILPLLASGVVAVAGLPGGGAAAEGDDYEVFPPARVVLTGNELVLPLETWGGRPLLDVFLDGRGPYPFILDTGASSGVVSAALATSLGLVEVKKVTVMSPGSETPLTATIVRAKEARIGAMTLHDLPLGAMDLSGVFGAPAEADVNGFSPQGRTPVGVLSASAFPGHLVTFDFARSRLRFEPGALPAADARRVFAYGEDPALPPLPLVPLRIGEAEFLAVLDTGAPHVLLLPDEAESRIPLRSTPEVADSGRTVDQVLHVRRSRVRGTMTVGVYSWEDPEVHFSRLPLPNIGLGALKAFEFTLDGTNRRFRLIRTGP